MDIIVSVSGYFTSAGSQQVTHVLHLLKARTSLVLCDVAISKCLSSMQAGKADAILLHDGRKSTRTAMLLRNAIMLARPLLLKSTASEPLSLNKGQSACVINSKIVASKQLI